MNSLNHYAYGSIAAWVYRYVIGISPMEEEPGFKRAYIAPKPSYHLDYAACELITMAGQYKVEWRIKKDSAFELLIEIPFDAAATVVLPRAYQSEVQMKKISLNEKEVISIQDVENRKEENDFEQYDWIQSGSDLSADLATGRYLFHYVPSQPYHFQWSLSSNFNELMRQEKTREIILKYFPRAERGIPFQGEASILEEILQSPFAEINDENMAQIKKELENV